MAEDLYVIGASGTDPYMNLALEKYLMDCVVPGQHVLYLWQNARTVVIGRNQSALDEVRVSELNADGGHLARRLSGGGAVYHDLGNLNFTFVTTSEGYDVDRQTEVILSALRSLGIAAERNGRNDLTVEGQKFSGHAYYKSGDARYHHGTLMVNVDVNDMSRYLKPAPEKLRSKGVQSVRARVANLIEFKPSLSIAELAESLVESFGKVYGAAMRRLDVTELDQQALEELCKRSSSPSWLYRDEREFTHKTSERFGWGSVTLRYTLSDGGTVDDCVLISDGLEADYLAKVPTVLRGQAFTPESVGVALDGAAADEAERGVARDITSLLFSDSKRGAK